MSDRDMSKVSYEDLQFEGGRLAKVNPYDRPQYMDGYELLALVHRLAVLLKEAKSAEYSVYDWECTDKNNKTVYARTPERAAELSNAGYVVVPVYTREPK